MSLSVYDKLTITLIIEYEVERHFILKMTSLLLLKFNFETLKLMKKNRENSQLILFFSF